MSIALVAIFALIGLTSYGVWLAFGPPNKELEDPFDHHDD